METDTKTVYVVTEGDYSAYHIVAVFDSHQKAQDFIDTYVRDGKVEAFAVNPFERELHEGWKPYSVVMERDGSARATEDGSRETFEAAILKEFYLSWWQNKDKSYRRVLEMDCFAKDEQHAIKIANEKRAQLIASGEWDKPD